MVCTPFGFLKNLKRSCALAPAERVPNSQSSPDSATTAAQESGVVDLLTGAVHLLAISENSSKGLALRLPQSRVPNSRSSPPSSDSKSPEQPQKQMMGLDRSLFDQIGFLQEK
jgi:hypothetical protein